MLKVFDRNMVPIGVLPSAKDVERKRRLNSDYGLSFLLPMNSSDYIEKITLKGHVRDEKGQYYYIDSRNRVRGGLELMAQIECQHIMFKLADFKMPYESYIEEGFGVSILSLTELIRAATGNKFSFVIDDVFELQDIKDFGRGNAMQALQFIINKYSCEMDPNNFAIHLKKQVGTDTGMQYRFKKNIISNSFKDDARTIVTRMYSQMKDGLTFIDLAASNLTTEEYALLNAIPGAIVAGVIKVNYLISPYAASWSNTTNTYYDGELINQDLEDPLELLEATRKALKEQEVPIIDVTVDAADLHKIDGTEPQPNIGDTVLCIDPDMELNIVSARVIELTEYPYEMDKHTSVSLANFMLRDTMDIIADLDRSKRIVDNLLSGAKIRTTAFENFAKLAIYDINNSKTEVIYDGRGILLQDKTNAQNQVVMSSNGIYLTTDGGTTPRVAMTANGIVAEVIIGILGEFVTLRANQIVVGDAGEKIGDALLASGAIWNQKTTLILPTGIYTGTLTTNQLIAGSAKIGAALIETLTVGSNVQMGPNAYIAWGNVTSQPSAADLGGLMGNSPKLTYIGPTGIYTGTLTAGQINAVNGIALGANATIDFNYNRDPTIATAQGTANSAQSTANAATSLANAIANGDYYGGTYIDGKFIYSPTIMTGTSGRYLKLGGSELKSMNSSTQDGISLDGSTGRILLYTGGSSTGGLYKDTSQGYEQFLFSHNNRIMISSTTQVDLVSNYINIGYVNSGSTRFNNSVTFGTSVQFNGSVSGVPISGVTDLQNQLNAITARLNYLENNAFILSYRVGGEMAFNTKNIAGFDSTSVLD